MVVFEDIERTDHNPMYPLERIFTFYNRVKNTEYNKFRNVINDWFSFYPQENKKKLLADFKSDFYSAFYELYMFTILKNLGFVITVEHSDVKTNTTPDFLCTDDNTAFYIECTATNGKSDSEVKQDNIKASIFEMMRKLDTPKFFLYIEKLELFTGKQPKTKHLIKNIQTEIFKISNINIKINGDGYSSNKFPKVYHRDEDYEIIVSFIQKNPEFFLNISHPIGMFPVEAEFVGIEETIPKALKKKISKYKKISRPFIVAVNTTENSTYNKDDLNWFLYGNKELYGQLNQTPIFKSKSAKNLIGIIETNVFPANIHKTGIDFYLNPEFENAKSYLSKFKLSDSDPLNSNVFYLYSLNNIINIPESWLDEIWDFN